MEESQVRSLEKVSRERIIYIINEFCDGNRMELARRADIGKSSISQYVNGTNAPGNITAAKIGAAFGIDPMWIMGFDVPMRKGSAADTSNDDMDLQIMELYKNLPEEKKRLVLDLIKNLGG